MNTDSLFTIQIHKPTRTFYNVDSLARRAFLFSASSRSLMSLCEGRFTCDLSSASTAADAEGSAPPPTFCALRSLCSSASSSSSESSNMASSWGVKAASFELFMRFNSSLFVAAYSLTAFADNSFCGESEGSTDEHGSIQSGKCGGRCSEFTHNACIAYLSLGFLLCQNAIVVVSVTVVVGRHILVQVTPRSVSVEWTHNQRY